MKSLLRSLVVAAMTLMPFAAMAVPAYPGLIKVTQPDGEVLQCYIVGDEYGHYYLTPDGIPVVADGNSYCYATLNGSTAVSTSVKAHNLDKRSLDEQALVATIDCESVKEAFSAKRLSKRSAANRSIAQSGVGVTSSFPNTGVVKALVILVQYTDFSFVTENANEYFTNLMNQENFSENDCTGSARDYFVSSSNGKFLPQFDVYGPVTLAHERSYYASDSHAAEMVTEAAKLLNSEINFKDYDTDGDGYVDNVYIFYAGQGANTSGGDLVWPHQWTVGGAGLTTPTYDKVKINRYACSNEVNTSDIACNIGTFIHEFSHVMGMPESYSGTLSVTPGYWDVMDIGCYLNGGRTPPSYSSFQRNALAWIDPHVLSATPEEIELEPLNSSNTCCLIPTSNYKEFFLLENRQKQGWDAYVPGHGLLIWHIDWRSTSGGINSDESHQNTDIVEANGSPNKNSTSNQAGYTFPGTSGLTEFTKDTTPGLVTSDGDGLDVPITEIAENALRVTFTVSGGFPIKQKTAVATEATNITTDSFTANWEAVEGATNYYLTVKDGSTNEVTETANCGTGTTVSLPSNWYKSFSSSKYYSTEGYYGEASPSLMLERHTLADYNGSVNYVRTCNYTADVTSISFWYRGNQNRDEDNLLIEGRLSDDTWVTIKQLSLPLSGTVETITDIPSGVKQVKFTANLASSVGTIALDDITIVAGGVAPISGYDNLATGNVTSTVVKGLTAGNTYKYYVTATDGTYNSKVSNTVRVTLNESSTVEPEPNPDVTTTDAPSYGIPTGATADDNYLTSFTATCGESTVARTWSAHPGQLYNLIDGTLTAHPGESLDLNLVANCLSTSTSTVYEDLRYDCAYIYTDWSRSGTHELNQQYGTRSPAANVVANYSTVMNINHTIDIPEDAAEGTSYIRVIYQNAWLALEGDANATNIEKGIVYDLPVTIVSSTTVDPEPDPNPDVTDEVPTYSIPTGATLDANYLTDFTATCGESTVARTWSAHPGQLYNLIDGTLTAQPGANIDLNLVANCLSTSTSTVYEDLRYDCAYIYTDWSRTGTHELDQQYGTRSPAANVVANYNTVMNINHTLAVPTDAAAGTSYIRVIYQNAWKSVDDELVNGIVYDLPVTVVTTSSVDDLQTIDADPVYYNLQGMRVNPNRMTPGIYIKALNGTTTKVLVR